MVRFPLMALLLLGLFACASNNNRKEFSRQDSSSTGLYLMPEAKAVSAFTHYKGSTTIAKPTVHHKNGSEVAQPVSVGVILAPLKVQWQEVTLANVDGPQVLTFAKGTRITFERKDFVRQDRKPIKGPIDIRLKEFYTKQEMLLHKLNTQTHKGELLESGGMIHIEAFNEGSPLEVAKGQDIPIEFPTLVQQPDMHVFYALLPGEDKPVEWIPGSNTISSATKASRFHLYSSNSFKENSVEFLFLSRQNSFYLESNLHDVVFCGAVSDVERSYTNRDSLLTYEGIPLSPLLGETPSGYLKAEFELNAFGKIKEGKSLVLTGPLKGANIDFRPLQTKRIGDNHNWEIIISPKEAPSSKLRFSFNLPRDIKKHVFLNVAYFVKEGVWDRLEYFLMQESARKAQESIQSSNTAKTAYYLLKSTRLGLINCDRFYAIPQEEKTDILILNAQDNVEYHLVFSKANAVLSANRVNERIAFSNVPKGAEANLIALRCENGSLLMAVLPITIGSGPVRQEDLYFANVTVEGFQKAIASLEKGNL